MAAITNTSKNALGQISPASILLGTSGDTLTFVPNANQELLLFNTDSVSRDVTIDGAGGTTIAVPGAGGTTVSVANGVTYTILAGKFAVVRLDTVREYCSGVVSIVADAANVVAACIIQ